MANTIPKKALVALPDSRIVPPEEAFVSVFDRGFHFGDSLYEVARSYDGILFALDEHLARLRRSAELAMYEVPIDLERIRRMVADCCRAFFRKFGNMDVYVRVTVSRGAGDLNIDRTCSSDPYPFVFVKHLEPVPERYYQDGSHYAVVSRRRNLPSALDPAMKSGNYLNNVLAMAEARAMGAHDALLLNYQGFVTEGTTNNVYAVRDGEIWTAPLSIGILAGITRDRIFDACRAEGIPIQERLFTVAELESCQEMFFSSSTKEVMPITKLSGRPVGGGKPGPVTKRVHQAFKAFLADYCRRHKAGSFYA